MGSRRTWLQFDAADRRDPMVASCAAKRAALLGAPEEGRAWLRPFWDRLGELGVDDRAAVAQGLVACLPGIGPDWLQRLEAAAQAFPREPAIAHAVGSALAERRLWGKARQLLETAAADGALSADERRHAWLSLARLAEEEGDNERAVHSFESAARLA
jgi:HemY protein